MRFNTYLQRVDTRTVTFGDREFRIYDEDLYRKLKWFTTEYDNNETLRKNYSKIKKFIHPFDSIGSTITTSFIPNCPPLKITNAFMKMYECMQKLDKPLKLKTKKKLTMYDVAGAPGMFVMSVERYLKDHHPDVELDWQSCSLVGGTALVDLYALYRSNPNRFSPCDVLNENDLRKCIAEGTSKGKFDLVTGDIGAERNDDYTKLQEELYMDLQWGQMVLALNLSAADGCMVLKMFTYVTEETTYLVDTLTSYFDQVYICKPVTSRIINDESYIICLKRNSESCNNIPLTRPKLSSYVSPNLDLYISFSNSNADLRMGLVSLLSRIIVDRPQLSFKELVKNTAYQNLLYNSIKNLNFTFYNMGSR